MSKPATQTQKEKLRKLGIEFSEHITLEEARELLISELPEVPKRSHISQRPEIFDSIMTRSEIVEPKYNDTGVRFIS